MSLKWEHESFIYFHTHGNYICNYLQVIHRTEGGTRLRTSRRDHKYYFLCTGDINNFVVTYIHWIYRECLIIDCRSCVCACVCVKKYVVYLLRQSSAGKLSFIKFSGSFRPTLLPVSEPLSQYWFFSWRVRWRCLVFVYVSTVYNFSLVADK
jgi:hypothetical protein